MEYREWTGLAKAMALHRLHLQGLPLREQLREKTLQLLLITHRARRKMRLPGKVTTLRAPIRVHSSIAHIVAMRTDAMRTVEEAIVEAAQNIITVAATLSANAIGTAVTAVTLQGIDDGDISSMSLPLHTALPCSQIILKGWWP